MTDLSTLAGGRVSAEGKRVLRGRIARAPSSFTDSMEVVVPSFAGALSFEVPASNWMPRPGSLPVAGAMCLLLIDSDDDALVPVYDGTNVDLATTAALTALAARVTALEAPLPIYHPDTLPIGSPDGTRALAEDPASGFRMLVVKTNAIAAGAWTVLSPMGYEGSSATSVLTSTATAQWNQPSPSAPSVTLPWAGSYDMVAYIEGPVSTTQTIVGVGIAPSTVGSTATPTVIGTGGLGVANNRVQLFTQPARPTGIVAGQVWTVRIFMQSIATFTPTRASLRARPVYILGVV